MFGNTVNAVHGHCVGIGDIFDKLILGIVHGVRPFARRIHREFAITGCTSHCSHWHKSGHVVYVSDRQLTVCCLSDIGFYQVGGIHPANDRSIIGADNGHSDHLHSTVCCFNCETVGVFHILDKLIMGCVGGVQPMAIGTHVEATKAVTARHIDLRYKRCGCRTVRINVCQSTFSGQNNIGFCQSCRAHACDYRLVVGTGDAYRHQFAGVISRGSCKAVGINHPRLELFVRVIHHIGPLARGVYVEVTKTVAALDCGLHIKDCGAVNISGSQCAGRRQCRLRLNQCGCAGTGDHGCVIGTVDSHCHRLCCTVQRFGRERVQVGLARCELVMRGAHAVVPCTVSAKIERTVQALDRSLSDECR